MSDDAPERTRPILRPARPKRPTRKLTLLSRSRAAVRRGADRVLGADLAWGAVFVVVTLVLLSGQRLAGARSAWTAGEIVESDVRAPVEMDVPDRELTAARRREVASRVPEVYVQDTERGSRLAAELAAALQEGRRNSADGTPSRLESPALEVLQRHAFDPDLERDMTTALGRVMRRPVVGNKTLLERKGSIVLMRVPGRSSDRVDSFDGFVDLDQARARVVDEVRRRVELPEREARALGELTASYVDANVYLDAEATRLRRQAEADAVPPVLKRVAKGELLVAHGEAMPEAVAEALREIAGGATAFGVREFLGLALVVGLLAFFLHRYSKYHQRGFRKFEHLHGLLVLMLVSTLVLARTVQWMAAELVDRLQPPFDRLDLYAYLVPMGAGSILVALLANGRIAIVYSAFAALLFGMLNGDGFHAMLWALLVQLSGVYAISTYRERAALLRAGLVVGGIGALAAMAAEVLAGRAAAAGPVLYGAGLAFLGGAVGVGLLISFTLPMLERLFDVLTDIRLLELSNVNNPLLQELAVKAPGSYNHSLVVGTLAEEGAKAIGANSLFCRVAACYHDIGKINHAEYYVENQRGLNPHDRLTPSMSALIISSHVKDGIKLAHEAGLPEQIVAIIPQHHGTRLMTYFYEKARGSADPALGSVKEEDFRYPGPKPQTREAAIFMLADAVEAAARTVEEPSPHRLKDMIRKITNTVVLDGQFDECDLTFSDLDRVQQAFLRFLVSMYHRRVDYPGFDFGKPSTSEARMAPADAATRAVVRGG